MKNLSIHRVILALLAAVVAAVVVRYSSQDGLDKRRCGKLMNEGTWLDTLRAEVPSNHTTALRTWQPPGCMIRDYKQKDFSTCLRDKRIVLAGDSNVRDLFWALAKKLDLERVKLLTNQFKETDKWKRRSIEFSSHGVDLDFIWDPFINSTDLLREVVSTQLHQPGHAGNHTATASVLIIGAGSWFARYLHDDWLQQYQDNLKRLYTISASPNQPTNNVSLAESILFLPIQTPIYPRLNAARWLSLTQPKLDAMNAQLMDLSITERANVLWSFNAMTIGRPAVFEMDGIHNLDSVSSKKADIILNLVCNRNSTGKPVPHDRTCCGQDDIPETTYVILYWVLSAILIKLSSGNERSRGHTGKIVPSFEVLQALFVFGSVLFYCFLADRTQYFTKEHKYFVNTEFLRLLGLVGVLGFFTVIKSQAVISRLDTPTRVQSALPQYLSRDQTDEMKGWMQAVILIYHWTGASQTIWIYQIVRVLVAAYLFLTGFGHSVFFLKKKDYSLKRVASVLIRLNLMSCALPYVMNTNYLFYYFAPLSSFWFLIIYLTMRIKQDWNTDTKLFSLKLYVSLLVVTVLVLLPGFFETVFNLFHRFCNITWDAPEWRFRVMLDLLIVQKGMLFGFFYHRFTHQEDADPFSNSRISWLERIKKHRISLSLLCGAALVPYSYFTTRFLTTKPQFNSFHIVLSIIPIVGFLALRNICKLFRTTYSSAFAWLGKISLETFTLQYHIWLAGDTRGLLKTGLFRIDDPIGRWVEFAILTTLFLYMSWWMAWATQILTGWIVYTPKIVVDRKTSGVLKGEGGLPGIKVSTPNGGNEKRRMSDSGELRSVDLGGSGEGWRSWSYSLSGRWSDALQHGIAIRLVVITVGMWWLNSNI